MFIIDDKNEIIRVYNLRYMEIKFWIILKYQ